jgi:hypothetical protein
MRKGKRITLEEARQNALDTMTEADRLRAEDRDRERAALSSRTVDAPPGDGWRVRYHVAAHYKEGYGGAHAFDTEEQALAHRTMMMEAGGYKVVDVWASGIRWVSRERESKA